MGKNIAEQFEDWAKLPLSSKLGILRAIRKAAGLTITDVAKATGLSIPYLSMLERGKYDTVRMETLGKIAEACGCYLRVEIINAKESIFYSIL